MASAVDIANSALNLLGASTISAFTDDSKNARLINQRYEPVRNRVFRSHAWNCLHKRVQLAQNSTSPVVEYDHAYALPSDCLRVLKQVGLKTKYITNFARSFKPIILDMPSDKFSQDSIHNTELWHYTDTFFSIISETTIDNRFITEKIYKPMLNLHPFIIIGAPRILELLKEKGYYTFEEMFDESYDTELDPVVRINKVISNVNNFSKKTYKEKHKIYKSIIPKLLHNRNHYYSTATTSSVNEFSKIFKTLEEST